MNLSMSPVSEDISLEHVEDGLTMYVNDPLMNWLNKSNGESLLHRPKSPNRTFFKLTHPKKFAKGEFSS